MNEQQAKVLLALLHSAEETLSCLSLAEMTSDETINELGIRDERQFVRDLISLIEGVAK